MRQIRYKEIDERKVFIERGRGPAKELQCPRGKSVIMCPWCNDDYVVTEINSRCDCGARVCGLMSVHGYSIKTIV